MAKISRYIISGRRYQLIMTQSLQNVQNAENDAITTILYNMTCEQDQKQETF